MKPSFCERHYTWVFEAWSGIDMELNVKRACRWKYLFMVMKRFGFHQSINDKPLARIKVNGDLSNQITLEWGTRQGCPISPILFVLFIEPLNQWIRQNDKIIGIEMRTRVHKVAAFADDILVYLKQPTQSFPELMSLLATYGSFSGYKVNIQKTQVLTFNYKPHGFITRSFCLNWEVSMTYLGEILSKDQRILTPRRHLTDNFDHASIFDALGTLLRQLHDAVRFRSGVG